MKRHILHISLLAISILLVTGIGSAGTGGKMKNRYGSMSFAASNVKNAMSVSGVYSGSLQGLIRVGDQEIVITKKTRIFKTGKGPVEYGTFVTSSPIHVAAVKKGKAAYAKAVIVSDAIVDQNDGKAGVLDPGEPR